MPGPGKFEDKFVKREEITLKVDSAAAAALHIAAAATGQTPVITRVFLTFQGTDQVTLQSTESTPTKHTGAMQFKVDGVLDIPDAWIVGVKGSGIDLVKGQAVQVSGYINFIYR